MNREMLSKALNQIDDCFISESISYCADPFDSSNESGNVKQGVRFAWIAACAAVLLTTVAFAVSHWGLQELWQSAGRSFPDRAKSEIQNPDLYAKAETWSARVTECYNDGQTIAACILVESDTQYLIVPSDANAYDSVSLLGLTGGRTLEEYAASNQKTLLHVGSSVGAEGYSAVHFERISDDEMKILIYAHRDQSDETSETCCTVQAWTEERELEEYLHFSLPIQFATLEKIMMQPNDPDSVPGLRFESAEVTETPFGVNVTILFETTDQVQPYRMECSELRDYLGSITPDGGKWRAEWFMGKGEITDSLTVTVYDRNETAIGTIRYSQ